MTSCFCARSTQSLPDVQIQAGRLETTTEEYTELVNEVRGTNLTFCALKEYSPPTLPSFLAGETERAAGCLPQAPPATPATD